MPITKEEEKVLKDVYNQIEATGFKDDLLDKLRDMSFKIVETSFEGKEYDYLFDKEFDKQCPMCKHLCNNDSKPLTYSIKINSNPSDFSLPEKGQYFVGFIASFTIKCCNTNCDWHKDKLIFHGHCAGFLKDTKAPLLYTPFPYPPDKKLYIKRKTLDEIKVHIPDGEPMSTSG